MLLLLLRLAPILSLVCPTKSLSSALIFSATGGFRHDSIPTAIEVLKERGSSVDIDFEATEDGSQFTDENLARYDVIVFLSTTGNDILPPSGKAALQNYLNSGGNFVGIHSASDCLLNDAFYGREIGAYFDYHPPLQNATVNVLDRTHPSTSMLPARWNVQDELYNFKSDPRSIGASVILSADESTYTDDGERKFDQGTPHPTAWYQEHGAGVSAGGKAGRSFYTSLGHLNETWRDDLFVAHVLGGITWVLQSDTDDNTSPDSPASLLPPTNTNTSRQPTSLSPSPQPSSAESTSPNLPNTSTKTSSRRGMLAAVLMAVGLGFA